MLIIVLFFISTISYQFLVISFINIHLETNGTNINSDLVITSMINQDIIKL